MKVEDDHDDEHAKILAARFANPGRALEMRTAEEAVDAWFTELASLSALTPRVEQMNLKFTRTFVDMVRACSKARGIKQRDYVELACSKMERRK